MKESEYIDARNIALIDMAASAVRDLDGLEGGERDAKSDIILLLRGIRSLISVRLENSLEEDQNTVDRRLAVPLESVSDVVRGYLRSVQMGEMMPRLNSPRQIWADLKWPFLWAK